MHPSLKLAVLPTVPLFYQKELLRREITKLKLLLMSPWNSKSKTAALKIQLSKLDHREGRTAKLQADKNTFNVGFVTFSCTQWLKKEMESRGVQ